jgi:thiamine kinase-like enzyme
MISTMSGVTNTTLRPDAAELIARASSREPLANADGKSGVPMERLVIDGEAYVTKQLSTRFDWVSRATGDYGCRVLACWRTGLLDELPDVIDHTIVAVTHEPSTLTTTLLMTDVSAGLVPEGSTVVASEQHARFVAHMATLHASFWDRAAELPQLTPVATRYAALSPLTAEIEMARPDCAEVPRQLVAGYAALDTLVPDAARIARALCADPWPLVEALDETPQTFVHGDWKMGNLGSHADGRTILLDWQWPGTAPACLDLAWYLAVNCDRLPESKEDAIARYRQRLGELGIETAGWFERQLDLCLLGAFVQLGWSKTHDLDELNWWAERAVSTAAMV